MSIFKKIIFVLIVCFIIGGSYIYFSPVPTAALVHQLFKEGVAVPPKHYTSIKAQTKQFNNIDYASEYEDGLLDIVVPKNVDTPLPTILWVHGGAYVGGDKKDVTEYAVQLSAKGYAVINMNYELAPSAKYPTPLKQMDEVYAFLIANSQKYNLDLNNLFIAGDSAGAQIASQYINIQVDHEYAKEVGFPQVIEPSTIRGALLFCGPYDLAAFANMGNNKTLNFIFDRIAWAYIGEKDWRNAEATKLASLTDTVSKNYVPTFITDGNSGSFEDHGKKLGAILKSYNIAVEEVYYPLKEAKLEHEYQFKMDTPQAQTTFNSLLKFMENQTP